MVKEEICTLENMGPSWIRITSTWGQSKISFGKKMKRDTNLYRLFDTKTGKIIMENAPRAKIAEFIE